MSILLDAVTRAKQQEMGEQLDPVLTPRRNIADNLQQVAISSRWPSWWRPCWQVAPWLGAGTRLIPIKSRWLPRHLQLGGKPRSSKPGNKMSLKDISNRLKPPR